jgi:hypothetical protein
MFATHAFKSYFFIFLCITVLCWDEFFFIESTLKRSVLTSSENQRKSAILHDRYLISSELSFGRLSNMKISIAEVIGLSLALNRTAMLPVLQNCKSGGGEGLNHDTYFEHLFDASALSRATVLSSSGIDLGRICDSDSIAVEVLGHKSLNSFSLINAKIFQSLELNHDPLSFGDDIPNDILFDSFPYSQYFLPKVRDTWGPLFLRDRLLPDKLALLNDVKCVILGRNYLSLNWARLPSEFKEVHRELVPHSAIRADVLDFFLRNKFIDSRMSTIIPFIAIHLRMGDYLLLDEFRSFGVACNNHPEMLVSYVKELLERYSQSSGNGTSLPIILATDDYNSNCAKYFQQSLSVSFLFGVSRFHSASCRGALFDQEILGASAFFFGDKMSTFSQSIHQIRTLRYAHTIETTTWL